MVYLGEKAFYSILQCEKCKLQINIYIDGYRHIKPVFTYTDILNSSKNTLYIHNKLQIMSTLQKCI